MNYQKLLNKIVYKNSIFIEVVGIRGFTEYYQKKKKWGKISKTVFEEVVKLAIKNKTYRTLNESLNLKTRKGE